MGANELKPTQTLLEIAKKHFYIILYHKASLCIIDSYLLYGQDTVLERD
jgi:hypothetical protein